MDRELETQPCGGLKPDSVKVMTQGMVCLSAEPAAAVEIRRGMRVISAEGREAGKVAAVAVSQDGQQVLCLILGHLPKEERYQSLPVDWIKSVEGEVIFLNASFAMVQSLSDWHST